MGRLLRKKTPGKTKKKKPSADPAAVSPAADKTDTKKTVLLPDSSEEPQKRPPVSLSKPSAGAKIISIKQEKNFLDKGVQFLREVKVELKKVAWPSRKQAIGSTVVVIILVMIISLFLGVVDISLSSLIRVVLQ